MSLVDCLVPHLLETERLLNRDLQLSGTLQTELLRRKLYSNEGNDGFTIEGLGVLQYWSGELFIKLSGYLHSPKPPITVSADSVIKLDVVKELFVVVPRDIYKEECLDSTGIEGILSIQVEDVSLRRVTSERFDCVYKLANGINFVASRYEYVGDDSDNMNFTDFAELNGVFLDIESARKATKGTYK